MPTWPGNGETDWNTKMLAYLAVSFNTDGTPKTSVFSLSALTTLDSNGDAMLKTHAYKAASDGYVSAVHDVDFGSGRGMMLYVGGTIDPFGGGSLVQVSENDGNAYKNYRSVSFEIAKDEYFEIRVYSGTPTIRWRSKGTLSKPIDQD